MSIDVRVGLLGDRQTKRVYDVLKKSHQRKVARTALTAQRAILQKAAKAQTASAGFAQSIGATKLSIGGKTKTYKATGHVAAVVGVRQGYGEKKDPFRTEKSKFGQTRRPIFYFHLIEFGTIRSRPTPFLEPAFKKTKNQMVAKGKEVMAREIEKLVVRERAKAAGR